MRKTLMVLLLLLVGATPSLAGWGDALRDVDKLITNRPAPAPEQAPAEEPPPHEERQVPQRGVDDEHFIQPDDYFIQAHGLDNNAWIWVDLAKMVTPPSSETKGEAEFMKVRDGQNLWSKYYWRTRIASRNELKLGMHLIAFNDHQRDDVYRAPEKKDEARGGGWFYAKITDMSDTFKGFVTVSGNYKVALKNIRLIVR